VASRLGHGWASALDKLPDMVRGRAGDGPGDGPGDGLGKWPAGSPAESPRGRAGDDTRKSAINAAVKTEGTKVLEPSGAPLSMQLGTIRWVRHMQTC